MRGVQVLRQTSVGEEKVFTSGLIHRANGWHKCPCNSPAFFFFSFSRFGFFLGKAGSRIFSNTHRMHEDAWGTWKVAQFLSCSLWGSAWWAPHLTHPYSLRTTTVIRETVLSQGRQLTGLRINLLLLPAYDWFRSRVCEATLTRKFARRF